MTLDQMRNPIRFSTRTFQLEIGGDATCRVLRGFDGKNLTVSPPRPIAGLLTGNGEIPATEACPTPTGYRVKFAQTDVTLMVRVQAETDHLIISLDDLQGDDTNTIDAVAFLDVSVDSSGTPDDPFAFCALALNVQTRVAALPGIMREMRATAFRRFAFTHAAIALAGNTPRELRHTLCAIVTDAPGLPCNRAGGPWALDEPSNYGSYLFNFDGITMATVQSWIDLVTELGFKQIDFHAGQSIRKGDCEPNRALYPDGTSSLKAVIDRLHEGGIQAGLHTYAHFIDPACPWVTPVPHAGLAKRGAYTLAKSLDMTTDRIAVQEPTDAVSVATGFFVRNSVTLQIDNELIRFKAVCDQPPYGFLECERGAWGTRAAPHAAGAVVNHLNGCFFLFSPSGDSPLLADVARKHADTFNACGFDMIYLDALDGQDVLGGTEFGWHYGARFAHEICRHVHTPVLLEMSTFHHHLWCVRSRMGAWDHPARAYKQFIDNHVAANRANAGMFLPNVLGWWSLLMWQGPNTEPTYPDDIEYLCVKALATDSALALMGIDPKSFARSPGLRRLTSIIRRYERLRLAGVVPAALKPLLAEPQREFTLIEGCDHTLNLHPVHSERHRLVSVEGNDRTWTFDNPYEPQPPRVRIETLLSAGPYTDAPVLPCGGITSDSSRAAPSQTIAAQGVTACISREASDVGDAPEWIYCAENGHQPRENAWCAWRHTFDPPLNLMAQATAAATQGQARMEGVRQTVGIGIWVHGDAGGQLLNVRLRSPKSFTKAIADHYLCIDFEGWRYVELVEPEAERVRDYRWPDEDGRAGWESGDDDHAVSGNYHIYRESVDFSRIESVTLWLHHLPPGRTVCCRLRQPRIIPLQSAIIRNPSLCINGRRLSFPVEIESGCYLEFDGLGRIHVYDRMGVVTHTATLNGPVPILQTGRNRVTFDCSGESRVSPRARVSLNSMGGKPIAHFGADVQAAGKGSLDHESP